MRLTPEQVEQHKLGHKVFSKEDPENIWCRQATIILDEALKPESESAEGEPRPAGEKP
jgi:hypothetical protein